MWCQMEILISRVVDSIGCQNGLAASSTSGADTAAATCGGGLHLNLSDPPAHLNTTRPAADGVFFQAAGFSPRGLSVLEKLRSLMAEIASKAWYGSGPLSWATSEIRMVVMLFDDERAVVILSPISDQVICVHLNCVCRHSQMSRVDVK